MKRNLRSFRAAGRVCEGQMTTGGRGRGGGVIFRGGGGGVGRTKMFEGFSRNDPSLPNRSRFRERQPLASPSFQHEPWISRATLHRLPRPQRVGGGDGRQSVPRRWWHRERLALLRRAASPYYRSISSQQSPLIRVIRQRSG